MSARSRLLPFCVAAVVLVLGAACGESADEPPSAGAPQEIQSSSKITPCEVLPKSVVEDALGTGELTAVEDEEFDCAYGSPDDDAQVTFSVAILVGGLETLEESQANTEEVVGKEHVRELTGIGDGAWVVDNGGGSYFTQTLVGEQVVSLYIYGDPEADPEQRFEAAEAMLTAAAANL